MRQHNEMNAALIQNLNPEHDERGSWFMQALRGDSDAATRLYAACVPVVRSWLRQRVSDTMAEECAHDAMVLAFQRGDRFQAGTSFPVWLRTLAWRLALKALRSDSRRKAREMTFETEHRSCGLPHDERVFAALERSVARLPGEERQIIRRRFELDHSASEIATSLGRSRVAVAVSIHRICKRLRTGLEHHAHAFPATNIQHPRP